MSRRVFAAVDHVDVTLCTDVDLPLGMSFRALADAIIDAIQAEADCSVEVDYSVGAHRYHGVTVLAADGTPLDGVAHDQMTSLVARVCGPWWAFSEQKPDEVIARDQLLSLATTHLYRDDPARAAACELAPQSYWQRRRATLDRAVALAAAEIKRHGGARAAARALEL